jgi:hypothetical protein
LNSPFGHSLLLFIAFPFPLIFLIWFCTFDWYYYSFTDWIPPLFLSVLEIIAQLFWNERECVVEMTNVFSRFTLGCALANILIGLIMFDKGGKEKNEKTKKDRTKLGDVISCRAVANRCLWWRNEYRSALVYFCVFVSVLFLLGRS